MSKIFFGVAGIALLLISQRLYVLARVDQATRYWVRTIQQAPDHGVLPVVQPLMAHHLEAIRTARKAERAQPLVVDGPLRD